MAEKHKRKRLKSRTRNEGSTKKNRQRSDIFEIKRNLSVFEMDKN